MGSVWGNSGTKISSSWPAAWKALERSGGGGVREIGSDGAGCGQQRLVQFGAGAKAGLSGNAVPGAFCSEAQNLFIVGIFFGRLPGEIVRHADEGVKDDEDGFITATVGVCEGRIIGRVDEACVIHGVQNNKGGMKRRFVKNYRWKPEHFYRRFIVRRGPGGPRYSRPGGRRY